MVDATLSDSDTTNETLTYLQACHSQFELGFLSYEKVINMDSTVQWFSSWVTKLLNEGMWETVVLMGKYN